MRADAARNRQRLIDAAAEVFAARGLDATLDDIARHAGVNVATAYRHFANKHELAREFLRQCIDRPVAVAEEAAAHPDPWAGLTQFLERSLELIASNRALVDVLTRAYGGEHFAELVRRTTAPLDRLLARCREAGVVRAGRRRHRLRADHRDARRHHRPRVPGLPYLPHRYIGLILAGLARQPASALPGEPLTEERLLEVATSKAEHPSRPSRAASAAPRARGDGV